MRTISLELVEDLADKFPRMPDDALKCAQAQRVFGRAGNAVIPHLNRGRDGVADTVLEALRWGITIVGNTVSGAINEVR